MNNKFKIKIICDKYNKGMIAIIKTTLRLFLSETHLKVERTYLLEYRRAPLY